MTSHATAVGVDPEAAAWLLNAAGSYLWHRANYQQAREVLQRALAIGETHLGSDHPETACSLNYLGLVLHGQGDLDGACTLHRRALAIREARLGPDHPETLESRRELAALVSRPQPDQ